MQAGNQVLAESIGQKGYVSFPFNAFKAVSAGKYASLFSLEVWSVQVLPLCCKRTFRLTNRESKEEKR